MASVLNVDGLGWLWTLLPLGMAVAAAAATSSSGPLRRRQVLPTALLLPALLVVCAVVAPCCSAFTCSNPGQRIPQLLKMSSAFTSGSSTAHLRGKVVWVTGASSGLGEQLALQAAAGGPRLLVISGRNKEALAKVADACVAASPADAPLTVSDSNATTTSSTTSGGGGVLVAAFDLGNAEARAAAATRVVAAAGAVDVLVNNAGVSTRGAAVNTKLDVDRLLMETNFFSAAELTKAVLPGMLEQQSGSIIVVNSIQGKIGLPYRAAYSASKHAVTGFFDALRAEVAASGVRVLQAYPGYIRTSLSMNAVTGDGTAYNKMDATTAGGEDPADVARGIWQADAAGRSELVPAPLSARVACLLRALAPRLLFSIMRKRAIKEAGSV